MPLTIFSSSAGSGKTYTLAREYLCLIINNPELAGQTLAVTFTNKATAEMKERVIRFLNELSQGQNLPLAKELALKLGLSIEEIKLKSWKSLNYLLHHFNDLKILTIDKFFQQIIRTFARDFELSSGFSLELDTSAVIDNVLIDLYGQIATHKELKMWLEFLVEQQIENGKSWNFRENLAVFSKEIFKEQYQNLSWTESEQSLSEFYASLSDVCNWFESELQKKADLLDEYLLVSDDYLEFLEGKSKNIVKSIWTKIKEGDFKFVDLVGYKKVLEPDYEFVKRGGKTPKHILDWADQVMILFSDLINFFATHLTLYSSCEVVKTNFSSFAITRIIASQLQKYKQQNDVFLLAESQFFLNKLIGNNDSSFIFEKTGGQIRHFLIDEFQDTSVGQWKNFLPLILNSLGQGNDNLLVGDVKQSIYRFRGGDLRLLLRQAELDVGQFGVEKKYLQTNWRSKAHIVEFNNAVFDQLPSKFQTVLKNKGIESLNEIQQTFSEAKQSCQAIDQEEKGFVKLYFQEKSEEKPKEDEIAISFIKEVKQLQDLGYQASQIAVLVDKNSEGSKVASWLAQASAEDESRHYNFDFISSDSLLLSSSLVVQCVVSALKFVSNSCDLYSFREYVFFKSKIEGKEVLALAVLSKKLEDIKEEFSNEFSRFQKACSLPLTEVLAEVLLVSGLTRQERDLQFLQMFIDLAYRFAGKESNDLFAFLHWWNLQSETLKLSAPNGTEAITIITIHKSKGLEFDFVLMPFGSLPIFKSASLSTYIWTSTNNKPFTSFLPVCVKSSQLLLRTYFIKEFQEEQVSQAIDTLNKSYVAFTRARIGLIAWFPMAIQTTQSIGVLLKELLDSGSELVNGKWSENQSLWEFGTVSQAPETQSIQKMTQRFSGFPISGYRQSLRSIVHSSKIKSKEIEKGLNFHQAMSSILTLEDAQRLINQFSDEVRNLIQKTIDHPEMHPFFDGSWAVKTEQSILLPDGTVLRPDRWQNKSDNHVLIDFKTGEPHAFHLQQMNTYLNAIKLAGLEDSKGFLFYPEIERIVEV